MFVFAGCRGLRGWIEVSENLVLDYTLSHTQVLSLVLFFILKTLLLSLSLSLVSISPYIKMLKWSDNIPLSSVVCSNSSARLIFCLALYLNDHLCSHPIAFTAEEYILNEPAMHWVEYLLHITVSDPEYQFVFFILQMSY